MKKVSKLIEIVKLIAKYAGVLIVIGETFNFLSDKLDEKFPSSSQNKLNTDV